MQVIITLHFMEFGFSNTQRSYSLYLIPGIALLPVIFSNINQRNSCFHVTCGNLKKNIYK